MVNELLINADVARTLQLAQLQYGTHPAVVTESEKERARAQYMQQAAQAALDHEAIGAALGYAPDVPYDVYDGSAIDRAQRMAAAHPIASAYGTRPGDESEAEPERARRRCIQVAATMGKTFAAIRDSGVFRGAYQSLYGTRPGDESEAELIWSVSPDGSVWRYATHEEAVAVANANSAMSAAAPSVGKESLLPADDGLLHDRPLMSANARMAKAYSTIRPLTERELAQRALLEQRLAGRMKPVDPDDIGAPYFGESVPGNPRAPLAADDTQPQTDVDRVLDQLDRRVVGAPERLKLRGALDKADAPDKSRTGQDAAVGRALRVER